MAEAMNEPIPNSWDWLTSLEDLLNEPMALVPPETAFHHLNHFDMASMIGQIAFILHDDVHSGLQNSEDTTTEIGYWAVEIIEVAGYFMKVKCVGYHDEELDALQLQPVWLHCSRLNLRGQVEGQYQKIPPKDLQIKNGRNVLVERCGRIVTEDRLVKLLPSAAQVRRIMPYQVGDTLEARDTNFVNCYREGTVDRFVGGRLEIGFYSSNTNVKISSYFCDQEWEFLHHVGWAAKYGAQVLVQRTKTGKTNTILNKGTPGSHPNIMIGQLFEMVNPIQMNQFAVGEITAVMEDGYFKCKILSDMEKGDFVQSANGRNEFLYHISSRYIFPCGTVQSSGELLDPPKDASDVEFNWSSYFAATSKTPMVFPANWEAAIQGGNEPLFVRGMLLECADTLTPACVAPGLVVKVMKNLLMKIRFLGWDIEFDQWRPMNDKTIYPAGWCKLMGYPLSAPGKQAIPPQQISLHSARRGRPKSLTAKPSTEQPTETSRSASKQDTSITFQTQLARQSSTTPTNKRPPKEPQPGPSKKQCAASPTGSVTPEPCNLVGKSWAPTVEDDDSDDGTPGRVVVETSLIENAASVSSEDDRYRVIPPGDDGEVVVWIHPTSEEQFVNVQSSNSSLNNQSHSLINASNGTWFPLNTEMINKSGKMCARNLSFDDKLPSSTNSKEANGSRLNQPQIQNVDGGRTDKDSAAGCDDDAQELLFSEKIVYVAHRVQCRSIAVQVDQSSIESFWMSAPH